MRIFILIMAICCVGCGQQYAGTASTGNVEDSARYVANAVDFIKTIKAKQLSDTSFILSDQVFAFDRFDCLASVARDTVNFSKEEIAWVTQQKYPHLSRWNNEHFPGTRFVNGDTITAIFKRGGPLRGWNEFYQRFGRGFQRFSLPIFLKSNTEVLFYEESSCGGLCGMGRLSLYRKENDKWVEVRKYCNWIS